MGCPCHGEVRVKIASRIELKALETNLHKDQIELNPKNLDKEAKCGVFNEYLTMPRKHHGQRVPSRLSDKVKRSVF